MGSILQQIVRNRRFSRLSSTATMGMVVRADSVIFHQPIDASSAAAVVQVLKVRVDTYSTVIAFVPLVHLHDLFD